jgi:phospholipid/cholesterol/gamma-HCH transport system substrate-binding protein
MKNTLEVRLGIFFALALIVAIIILEMVGAADFFKKGYIVHASFKNVQELKKGDPVKMAGVEIGRVDDIRLIDTQARVSMKIEGKYRIKTDARATIRFAGLMGQNFLYIDGGTPNAPRIEPGGFIETGPQTDMYEMMAKLQNVASGVENLTKSFSAENLSTLIGPMNDFLRQNSTNISSILSNTASVSFQISQGHGTLGRLIYDDALYNTTMSTISSLQAAGSQAQGFLSDARGMLSKASGVMDEISTGQGTIGRLLKEDKLYVQTTETMDNLKQILEKVNRGQGSVGKLINDETFLKNARMTLQKVDKATEGLEDQGPLSVLGIAVNTLF